MVDESDVLDDASLPKIEKRVLAGPARMEARILAAIFCTQPIARKKKP